MKRSLTADVCVVLLWWWLAASASRAKPAASKPAMDQEQFEQVSGGRGFESSVG